MTNPFEQLEAETQDTTPTLASAAMEIHLALSQSLTAKGLHRPRPLSWGKRIARTHFGWSRIGEKKWAEILSIGEKDKLWIIDDKNKLVYADGINDSEGHSGPHSTSSASSVPSALSSKNQNPHHNNPCMAAFYRSAGALGNWRVLTEDDWDGSTYTVIKLPWMDKSKEVPKWKAGQVTYELYDQKVREDMANGAERSYCTSCKSQINVTDLFPDSHGRICCAACNDREHPRLIKPDDWVPPAPVARPKSKVSQGPILPETKTKSRPTRTKKNAAAKLRSSVRRDGKADLMDATDAIASAE